MQDLSLHILDVAENSVRAGATRVEICLTQDDTRDMLRLDVSDNGRGMDEALRERVLNPFTTTRTERDVGLGLALLAQAAREAEGTCDVESTPGRGTRVTATFRLSHIDRKPLGDLTATVEVLAVGNPGVDFLLELNRNGVIERLDTAETRSANDGAV